MVTRPGVHNVSCLRRSPGSSAEQLRRVIAVFCQQVRTCVALSTHGHAFHGAAGKGKLLMQLLLGVQFYDVRTVMAVWGELYYFAHAIVLALLVLRFVVPRPKVDTRQLVVDVDAAKSKLTPA
jgi:hypothetical protein